MIRRLPVAALVLSASTLVGIAMHEGYRGEAHIPVPGDVPTIGYGETKGVRIGDRTDPVRALVRLQASADEYAQAVRRCAPVPMHQYEFSAFVSLTYNIGQGAFCASSIPAQLAAGNYAAACETIMSYVCGPATEATRAKPGQRCYSTKKPLRVIRGLENRRQAEYRECIGQ